MTHTRKKTILHFVMDGTRLFFLRMIEKEQIIFHIYYFFPHNNRWVAHRLTIFNDFQSPKRINSIELFNKHWAPVVSSPTSNNNKRRTSNQIDRLLIQFWVIGQANSVVFFYTYKYTRVLHSVQTWYEVRALTNTITTTKKNRTQSQKLLLFCLIKNRFAMSSLLLLTWLSQVAFVFGFFGRKWPCVGLQTDIWKLETHWICHL